MVADLIAGLQEMERYDIIESLLNPKILEQCAKDTISREELTRLRENNAILSQVVSYLEFLMSL